MQFEGGRGKSIGELIIVFLLVLSLKKLKKKLKKEELDA